MDVAASQLSTFWLQGGTVNGTDTLRVQVFDGFDWSVAKDVSVVTRGPNTIPVATASNGSVRPNQAVAASTLCSATDADGDAITQYRFWDGGTGGGFFKVSAAQQPAQTNITVNAVDLSTVSYVGGVTAGNETEWVQVFDGFDWSAWTNWTMSTDTTDTAGNTAGAARAVTLGTVAKPTNVKEDVGAGADIADCYSFTLPSQQTVHLNLGGLSGDLTLQLLDQGGTHTVATSNQAGTAAETINQTLAAGTYHVLVTPVGGANSNYTLAFSQG